MAIQHDHSTVYTLLQPDLEMTVKPYLQQWYDTVTKYLCRCLNVLGEDTKYLIHAVSSMQCLECDTWKTIHVSQESPDVSQELDWALLRTYRALIYLS